MLLHRMRSCSLIRLRQHLCKVLWNAQLLVGFVVFCERWTSWRHVAQVTTLLARVVESRAVVWLLLLLQYCILHVVHNAVSAHRAQVVLTSSAPCFFFLIAGIYMSAPLFIDSCFAGRAFLVGHACIVIAPAMLSAVRRATSTCQFSMHFGCVCVGTCAAILKHIPSTFSETKTGFNFWYQFLLTLCFV